MAERPGPGGEMKRYAAVLLVVMLVTVVVMTAFAVQKAGWTAPETGATMSRGAIGALHWDLSRFDSYRLPPGVVLEFEGRADTLRAPAILLVPTDPPTTEDPGC